MLNSIRITDGWDNRGAYGEGPAFRVFRNSTSSGLVAHVQVSDTARAELSVAPADVQGEAFQGWALNRLRRLLEEKPDHAEEVLEFKIDSHSEEDIATIRALLDGAKQCLWQVDEGRDLFCLVPSSKDTTVRLTEKGQRVAPTSPSLCGGCEVPSKSVLCSHFSHPQVAKKVDQLSRHFQTALCRAGHDDRVSTATECRPGGHDCWEQVVAPPPVGAAPSLGPLAILEAFDHLDAVWRARGANHQRLVELKSAYSTGILGLACTNRDEFQRFIGSLADLLDHMRISDELQSQEATEQSRDGSLNRFKAWAMASLQEDDQAQAIEALTKLQQIRMLRNHFLHSGASSKLPNSLAVLGISYPPDWGQAWEMVTHKTVDALRQLREAISV